VPGIQAEQAKYLTTLFRKSTQFEGDKMSKIKVNTAAPDFVLDDFRGATVRLGDYRGAKHIVLVFNRGFT
jgi:hypothetical protein